MSCIYFHSEHGAATVRGPERFAMGLVCSGIAWGFLESTGMDTSSTPSPLRRVLSDNCYALQNAGMQFTDSLRVWFKFGAGLDDSGFVVNGARIEPWIIGLNTSLRVGDDPVRLFARLHAQCEIHAYVEGGNRAWLAEIIERGRASGLYRAEMGWEGVIELLRSRDDCPVVTSYSICEQFPNAGIAAWEPPPGEDGYDEPNWDAWYDLSPEQQWGLALMGLRSQVTKRIELKPDDWRDYTFGAGVDVFQLIEAANKEPAPATAE